MKSILIVMCLLLVTNIACPAFSIFAQSAQTEPAAPDSQPPLPNIPPTPRSKLEIIQYALLPFAIGASLWLILRLEKMEREEAAENKEK